MMYLWQLSTGGQCLRVDVNIVRSLIKIITAGMRFVKCVFS